MRMERNVPIQWNPMDGQRLRILHGNHATILHGLGQLRGRVRIRNVHDALRFVRLRTSPVTCLAWLNERIEVEIVKGSQRNSLPNFGIVDSWATDWTPSLSGSLGRLSEVDFRNDHFEAVKVRQVPGGFSILRWTFSGSLGHESDVWGSYSIQKVKEFVGKDGDYKRSVVKTRPQKSYRRMDCYFPDLF